MKLFDADIRNFIEQLQSSNPEFLCLERAVLPWEQKEEPVLRTDMAYELGGGSHFAIGGLGFTLDETLVPQSGVYLVGPDLPEIESDISYARITLVRLHAEAVKTQGENGLYRVMRQADYVKYHLHPKGYLLRISSAREREPVRISRQALVGGMNFATVGYQLVDAYLKLPEVAEAAVYFVTKEGVDYQKLFLLAQRMEQITDSCNHIFSGLKMDCNTCNLKAVCDEVEGLKELHFGQQTGAENR